MFSHTPLRSKSRDRHTKVRKNVQWQSDHERDTQRRLSIEGRAPEVEKPEEHSIDGSKRHQDFYDYSDEQKMFDLLQSEPEKVTQMLMEMDISDEEAKELREQEEGEQVSILDQIQELTLKGAEYTGNALRKGMTPAVKVALAAAVCYYIATHVSLPSIGIVKGPGYEPPAQPPQDISELSSRLQKLESELFRVGSDSDNTAEWISLNKALIKELPSKIESVEEALGGIDAETEKLSKSIEKISKDTRLLRDDNNALSNAQNKWINEVDSLKRQLIRQREAINAIKTNEMDTTPALAILGGTVERIDGDLTRLTADLEKRQKLDSTHITQLVKDAVKRAVPDHQPDFFEEAKDKLEEYIASVVPEIKAEVLEIVSSIPNQATNDTVDFSALISNAVDQKVDELDLESLFVAPEELKTALDKEIGQVKNHVDTKVAKVESEVKEVKSDVVKIQSDIRNVQTEVAQVEANKTAVSQIPREDGGVAEKIINFASLINGARIDTEYTTGLYDPWRDSNSVYWAFRNTLSTVGIGKPLVRRPWVALIADMSGGSCWPFNGRRGQLAVKLAAKMIPTSFSLKHAVAADDSFLGSAPRFFNIWIKVDDSKLRDQINTASEAYRPHNIPGNFILVGQYEFDPAENPNAWYPVPQNLQKLEVETEEAIFEFTENWGLEKFTCVYQVGVHGVQVTSQDEVEEVVEEVVEEQEDGSQSIMNDM